SLVGWMGFVGFGLFSVSYEFRHRRVVAAQNGDVQSMNVFEKVTMFVGGSLIIIRLVKRLME
ncbi:MAG TPA: hypothetical protein PLJ65_13895, partial [Casimicrobium sp.]|nr:hypothetical protein [Casimicrobium sp.]